MADGDASALVNLAGTSLARTNAQGVQFSRVTTIDMADAAHAIVIGAAGAAETQLLGNIVYVDAGGNVEILTLPAEADSAGLCIALVNTGGETITVNNDAAATIVSVLTAECAVVWCDGTSWYGLVGAAT